MNVFLRAVIMGFGYSLGAALFKKVSKRFDDNEEAPDDSATTPDHPVAVDKDSGRSDEPGDPANPTPDE